MESFRGGESYLKKSNLFKKRKGVERINITNGMVSIKFNDLIFPKAMNLHLLSEILDDGQMMDLIKKHEGKTRKERRIVLPSRKLIRKCIIYYYAIKHKENFEEVLKILKGDFKTLEEADLRKDKIVELYENRKREIENEK